MRRTRAAAAAGTPARHLAAAFVPRHAGLRNERARLFHALADRRPAPVPFPEDRAAPVPAEAHRWAAWRDGWEDAR